MELCILNIHGPFGFVMLGCANELVDVRDFLCMATSKLCELHTMLCQESGELCVQCFLFCLIGIVSDF
jgi:hypothetical protein